MLECSWEYPFDATPGWRRIERVNENRPRPKFVYGILSHGSGAFDVIPLFWDSNGQIVYSSGPGRLTESPDWPLLSPVGPIKSPDCPIRGEIATFVKKLLIRKRRRPANAVSKIVLAQQIKVARVPFHDITRGIKLHSIAERKLKGFGQCVSAWLEMWRDGKLTLREDEHWQEISETEAVSDHTIYLSLNAEASELLRTWKDALQQQIDDKLTMTRSILALTALVLHRSG